MTVKCVWEHNGDDTLLYAENFIGAYTRGANLEIARSKMPDEIRSYLKWIDKSVSCEIDIDIVQEKASALNICDADSDVIFDSERAPLTSEEYSRCKELCLKSARDFLALFDSIENKDKSALQSRQTFYGVIPRTAREMYEHTKNVNSYYFGEIGVDADNDGNICLCRERGFAALEAKDGFLSEAPVSGSYDEMWSLKKVLRRFLWHDRIHAKAMYRMALKTFGAGVKNIFCF
ncbi:MAG: hypothetical protein NC184_05005 [Roseburia sp.]|nr:hypothetical protein [Roseburia sp.]